MTHIGIAGNAGARFPLRKSAPRFPIAQDVHILVAVQQKMH
jgi:hypothetical protein